MYHLPDPLSLLYPITKFSLHYVLFSIVLQPLGGDNCLYVSIGSADGGTYHYNLRFSLTTVIFGKARSSVFFTYQHAIHMKKNKENTELQL